MTNSERRGGEFTASLTAQLREHAVGRDPAELADSLVKDGPETGDAVTVQYVLTQELERHRSQRNHREPPTLPYTPGLGVGVGGQPRASLHTIGGMHNHSGARWHLGMH